MERRLKTRAPPEIRGRKHQTHPSAPFSPPSFPCKTEKIGPPEARQNGLDGTSPRCSRSLFSSEPVSSFPNRKLNLRFGFSMQICDNLSVRFADSSLEGEPWAASADEICAGHGFLAGGGGRRRRCRRRCSAGARPCYGPAQHGAQTLFVLLHILRTGPVDIVPVAR